MQHPPYQPEHILDGGLLQGSAWQDFQKALGKRVFQVEGQDFFGRAILSKIPFCAPYFYFPRGPFINPRATGLHFLSMQLSGLQKETGIAWARVEPQDTKTLALLRQTFPDRLRKAPHPIQPEETLIIDLAPSLEELLDRMKSKTRYNVRLAEKHGVTVRQSSEPKDFLIFEKLLKATATRKGIRTHSSDYYRQMLETLPNIARLFIAEHKGNVLAANLIIFFGDSVTYLHGGTSAEGRALMAPFLLQWEQIRTAKREGYRRYDFGGVRAATRGDNSEWDGITRFKRGFAPAAIPVHFPGTYDIVLKPSQYKRYLFLRSFRNFLR